MAGLSIDPVAGRRTADRPRLEVVKSAMDGFDKMVKVEREGGRPVN